MKANRKVAHTVPVAISLHLHDTRGLGLANMVAGYEGGLRIFDVAAGRLGGCPFVKRIGDENLTFTRLENGNDSKG
jgi:hydroxymethylglutaryl-CoA lyase